MADLRHDHALGRVFLRYRVFPVLQEFVYGLERELLLQAELRGLVGERPD